MDKTTTLTIPARILDEWVPKFEDRDADPKWEPAPDPYRSIMAAVEDAGDNWRIPLSFVRFEATPDDCKEIVTECDFSINPAYGKDRLVSPETADDRATLAAYIRLMEAARKGMN